MYRQAYQRGMLTIFYSVGSKPLANWDTYTQNGYISRFLDHDIKSMVLEIGGTNVSTTYMVCPKGNKVLGITMPFLIMVVKNLRKYFAFEVTVLDETGTRRRFRVANFQSTTQVLPLCTVMPIVLSEGWNQIQFNLAEFTRRAYRKQLVEIQKIKINANIRLRRIYFAERLMTEDQLPSEYKLYFPLSLSKGAKDKKDTNKNVTTGLAITNGNKDSKVEVTPIKLHSLHSLQSIKRPSQQLHGNEDSPSKLYETMQDNLERTGGATTVPIVADSSRKTSEAPSTGVNEDVKKEKSDQSQMLADSAPPAEAVIKQEDEDEDEEVESFVTATADVSAAPVTAAGDEGEEDNPDAPEP